RSNTAYHRFLRTQRAADVILFAENRVVDSIRALPEVADSGVVVGFQTTEPGFFVAALADDRFGRQLNRFKVLSGRLPDPNRADEVVVGFVLAKSLHLRVGGPLSFHVVTTPPSGTPAPSPAVPPGPQAVTARVVGVMATPGEFPPLTGFSGSAYISGAFLRTPLGAAAARSASAATEIAVILRHGAGDVGLLQTDLTRVAGGVVGNEVLAAHSADVERSMHLQAVALWLMVGCTGLALALIMLQLLTRQGLEDATDHRTLRALGMTPSQLLASGMVRVAAMAVLGAAE